MASSKSTQFSRIIPTPSSPAPLIDVRFFYTTPLEIDDPLSPFLPPLSLSDAVSKQVPRPFSAFDNTLLEKTWSDLRQKILNHELISEAETPCSNSGTTSPHSYNSEEAFGNLGTSRTFEGGSDRPHDSRNEQTQEISPADGARKEIFQGAIREEEILQDPSQVSDIADPSPSTTEESFVTHNSTTSRELHSQMRSPNQHDPDQGCDGRYAKVAVGASRVYCVTFPNFLMEPIYWSPTKDVAPVMRGTWFYHENMLPVEAEVSNLLEAGYLSQHVWTESWKDELERAVEDGALGEMRILYMLWPDRSRDMDANQARTNFGPSADASVKQPQEAVAAAREFIDTALGPKGPDNKAAGSTPYGRDGTIRQYDLAGIIFANDKDAYILEPSLQPSDVYWRRPLANYIRRNWSIGIRVVRGFDQEAWDRMHPVKKASEATKPEEEISAPEATTSQGSRESEEPSFAHSNKREVTDLVLVIHGIGQKLSERVESYHFTHAINGFRRDVIAELVNNVINSNLREDMGGIMVLPVRY